MRAVQLLTVGKIKTSFWQESVAYYTKRISHTLNFTHSAVKDAEASLPKEEKIRIESERLAKKILPGSFVISLDACGLSFTSEKIATVFEKKYECNKQICFLIGGAYGLSESIKKKSEMLLALSTMTFPHELATVLFLEQLYRAETIHLGTGYHH